MFARPCLLYSVKADAPYFTICLQRMQDPELNFFLQTTEQGIILSPCLFVDTESSVTFPSSLQFLHFISSPHHSSSMTQSHVYMKPLLARNNSGQLREK